MDVNSIIDSENLAPLGPVCSSHIELVGSIRTLCTSLRWFLLVVLTGLPLMLGFGIYSVTHINNIERTCAITEIKYDGLRGLVETNTGIIRQMQFDIIRVQEQNKQNGK